MPHRFPSVIVRFFLFGSSLSTINSCISTSVIVLSIFKAAELGSFVQILPDQQFDHRRTLFVNPTILPIMAYYNHRLCRVQNSLSLGIFPSIPAVCTVVTTNCSDSVKSSHRRVSSSPCTSILSPCCLDKYYTECIPFLRVVLSRQK